ncbi:helix-turn-helix transcriptional regulator [Rhizobium sp. BK176]|uniref:helix-turn-helix transcriptional regulator n=1 Tax=Rhizobium sp. BK176 TaxID=2587071 RepID=UPI002167269A|nr:helix-turn-helix transcriptional regulator [Rhizobium sp. BK176]MCS4088507.1 DNA-binding XRE family transcriptional regulator [Rhizobium sp. BK176]
MAANNLKSKRQELEMTQKAVADAVHISQQHLQRLEAGTSPVKIKLAEKIATVLNCTIDDLFPRLAEVVRRDHGLLATDDAEARRMLNEWDRAGIDIDGSGWMIIWRIPKEGTHTAKINGLVARTLMADLDSKLASGFLIFDSPTHRHAVAIAPEIPIEFRRIVDSEGDDDDDAELPRDYRTVKVYRRGNDYSDHYEVQPDEGFLSEAGTKRVQVQQLFQALEGGLRPRISLVHGYDNENPEDATISYIGVASILAVSAPLSVVDPAFRQELEKAE